MADQGVGSSNTCLLSTRDTAPLVHPVRSSKKIKYTCIAASLRYVALGANTGGVYCFHRDTYKYIRILANKEGSVSMVRFSPDGDYLAVCSGGGYVGLWELNLHDQGISKRLHVCSSLKEGSIRDLVWDSKTSRVFLGDDQGRVAVTYLPKQQKLFKKPDELLLQEKVPIVQLDLHQELLLISTTTRCLIYRLLSRDTVQVGSRPRDGMFGACFYERGANKPPIVLSDRPGGRLWQADVEGTVVSTLKLKDAVSITPSPVLGFGFSPDFSTSSTYVPPLVFSRLALLHGSLMVGWVGNHLFLFEPTAYRLAAWTTDIGSILDLYSDGRQLFVLCEGGGVKIVSFVSLGTCVHWLVKLELHEQAVQVLTLHSEEISVSLDSDETLYSNVRTLLTGAEVTTLTQPLQALKTRVGELEEKYRHLLSPPPQETTIEESPTSETDYQTAELIACTDDTLDSADHVTSDSNHVTSDSNHVTLQDTPVDTHHSADFPITFNSTIQTEPSLDSTLIPDDLTDPLASDSQTSLTQDLVDTAPTSKETSRSNSRRSSTITAYPENTGRDIHNRSLSQAIPSVVTGRTGVSLEGTPEYGTSILSSSHSGLVSNSIENRSSLEPEGVDVETRVHKRAPPDFANRVAAALSSFSPDNDDIVVAVPRRSSSGSLKEGGKKSSKKRNSKKKKSASPQGKRLSTPDLSESLSSKTPSPSRSLSLVHIPEEILPFPEAGLPTPTPPSQLTLPHSPSSHPHTPPSQASHPTSRQTSATSSLNPSPHHSRPHTPPPVVANSMVVQNGFIPSYTDKPENPSESIFPKSSTLLSKVKNIARQGVTESNKLQRPVKMVKDLLSSLANPQLAGPQPTLYTNENFVPSVSPPTQSTFPTSPPPEQGEMVVTTPPPVEAEEEPDAPPIMNPQTALFIEATTSTWTLLEDPVVYCNPESVLDPLRDWLFQLDVYREYLLESERAATNGEGTSERAATDGGWSLGIDTLSVKESVRELVSLCLEMGCYGNDPSPQGLAKFVVNYCPVLDMRRAWNVLSQQNWSVRAGVWKQLAECVSEGEKTLPELTSEQTLSELYRLPALLRRLYSKQVESFVDVCVSCFPFVSLWEVAVACEDSQSDDDDRSHDLYTDYLSRLMANQDLSTVMFADSALLLWSLEAILQSKRIPSVLESVCEWCVEVGGETVTRAKDLCLKHRHWWGVVRLSVALGDKKRALSVLVYMKDISLLANKQKWGNLLTSFEDWQLLIELLSSPDLHLKATPTPHPHSHSQVPVTGPDSVVQDKPTRPKAVTATLGAKRQLFPVTEEALPREGECDPLVELTWAGVLRLMIGSLPPELVLKLLSDIQGSGFNGVLYEQLHSVLTQLVQVQSKQRALGHSLLERVDQYLWSPRPTAIAPQLLTVQNSEMTRKQGEQSGSLLVTSVNPLSEWLEDAGVHWGGRISPASSCPLCRLSLLSAVSDLEPGVIALRCGHAYHKRCLPESACLVCFSKNVKTDL